MRPCGAGMFPAGRHKVRRERSIKVRIHPRASVPSEVMEGEGSTYERVIEAIPLSTAFREMLGDDALRPASEPGSFSVVCPFHPDKNPSLSLSDSKKVWNCFGCGACGNLFTLEMRRFELDSVSDALKSLSKRYPVVSAITGAKAHTRMAGLPGRGVLTEFPPAPSQRKGPVEPRSREWGSEMQAKATVLAVLQCAQAWFVSLLQECEPARQYLEHRGLTPDMIEQFGFGYSPSSTNLRACVEYMAENGFSEDDCVLAGVARRSEKGHVYDAFRDRVMIPIRDEEGKVISFAGRLLAESEKFPKYINGGNSPVFRKSDSIYGIDLARESESVAQEYGMLVLVEGYMDAISFHQRAGGKVGCVASMGTAVSARQLEASLGLLMDRADGRLIINLDGDAAGYAAAERLCESVLPGVPDTNCVYIAHPPPPFKDAGEYLDTPESSIDAYIEHLDNTALPWIEWRVRRIVEEELRARNLQRAERDVDRAAELASRGQDGQYPIRVGDGGVTFTATLSAELLREQESLMRSMAGSDDEGAGGGSTNNKGARRPYGTGHTQATQIPDESESSESDQDNIAGCSRATLDKIAKFVDKAAGLSIGINLPWLVHTWADALSDGVSSNVPILFQAITARIDDLSGSRGDVPPNGFMDHLPPPLWAMDDIPRPGNASASRRAAQKQEGAAVSLEEFLSSPKLMKASERRMEFQNQHVIPTIERMRSAESRRIHENPRAAAEESCLRSILWSSGKARYDAYSMLLSVMIRMEANGVGAFWTSAKRRALFQYLGECLELDDGATASVEELASRCEKKAWWCRPIELLFVNPTEFEDDELLTVRVVELERPVESLKQAACSVEEMATKVAMNRAAGRLADFMEPRFGNLSLTGNPEQDAEDLSIMADALSGRSFLSDEERARVERQDEEIERKARLQRERERVEATLERGEFLEYPSHFSPPSDDDTSSSGLAVESEHADEPQRSS